mgnify:CR=1 FL=1
MGLKLHPQLTSMRREWPRTDYELTSKLLEGVFDDVCTRQETGIDFRRVLEGENELCWD